MNLLVYQEYHRNYNLSPVRNSWNEFVILSTLLSSISRAIDIENEKRIKYRLKRKRKRTDSIESDTENSEDSEEETREIKRLKSIEKKLKRKYQEMLYG